MNELQHICGSYLLLLDAAGRAKKSYGAASRPCTHTIVLEVVGYLHGTLPT